MQGDDTTLPPFPHSLARARLRTKAGVWGQGKNAEERCMSICSWNERNLFCLPREKGKTRCANTSTSTSTSTTRQTGHKEAHRTRGRSAGQDEIYPLIHPRDQNILCQRTGRLLIAGRTRNPRPSNCNRQDKHTHTKVTERPPGEGSRYKGEDGRVRAAKKGEKGEPRSHAPARV